MSANQINYKQKYQELKMKFMESVDAAYRIGFEQGAQQAAMDQMVMQQQQQAEMEAAAAGGGPDFSGNGAEGSPAGAEQQANPNAGQIESENPAGSELDQHIAKLESMLKSDKKEDMEAAIASLRGYQAKMTQAIELKKSAQAIPAIAKALHKPAFKIGKQASHNMSSNAKAAVTMQHKIVEDIMKSWENEEEKASKEIKSVLNVEGLSKSEE